MIYVKNSFIPWISNIVFISILFVAFFPAFLIVNYQGHIDVMSRGRIDVTSRGRTNLTSWGCPEITYRGRLNLTFKGRPWEIDSGNLQDVLRTFPRGSSEYSNLDVPTFFFNFSFKTYSIDQIYVKALQYSSCIENPVKLPRFHDFWAVNFFVKVLHRRRPTGLFICLWYCLVMLFGMLIAL